MNFLTNLSELAGKVIATAYTDGDTPRLLLVFADETAAVVLEDTSGCYYLGEHGGMMLDDEPDGIEIRKARELYDAWAVAVPPPT